ncbi:MAG: tRNA-specific adenosine deaminase [Alkaliphilus sp.]|nr:nucleoside deaminase [Alkaliphilus sp. AH-315-G20]MBN4067691.1 nucleoside deaminase [Alkaliphilus transvaalensis]MBN4069662.1 nucleoside deaminase [bacterium AH-315-G05]PHS34199.1 MAG: tRNA-specific adenosine deaminase [Alkaliphilus sp.]
MHEYFMEIALKEAKKAYDKEEVPIGTVITLNDEVIAKAHNLREISKIATAHAELLAINEACKVRGDWRLTDCNLYVTIEPCPMCAGAIILSRIEKVIIGAMDYKSGACGSVINLLENDKLNHQAEIITGVLEYECSEIMKSFFRKLRSK